jgi:hypothetical protein
MVPHCGTVSGQTTHEAPAVLHPQVDRIDHMISAIDNSAGLWGDTLKQAPVTANSIVPNNKIWSTKIQEQIEAYEGELGNKVSSLPCT